MSLFGTLSTLPVHLRRHTGGVVAPDGQPGGDDGDLSADPIRRVELVQIGDLEIRNRTFTAMLGYSFAY